MRAQSAWGDRTTLEKQATGEHGERYYAQHNDRCVTESETKKADGANTAEQTVGWAGKLKKAGQNVMRNIGAMLRDRHDSVSDKQIPERTVENPAKIAKPARRLSIGKTALKLHPQGFVSSAGPEHYHPVIMEREDLYGSRYR